jgi:hypothetical protein
MALKNPCLGCGKECTGQQYSVLCTFCSFWCHKEYKGISDAFFKNLELQKKEIGQSFWACRSCVSFASTFALKVNAKLKEVNNKVDALQAKVDENSGGLGEVQEEIKLVEKKVGGENSRKCGKEHGGKHVQENESKGSKKKEHCIV